MMANSTFEWRGGTSTIKSYHYAGSTRLAIRMGTTATSTVNYLLADHLGSVAVTANASCARLTELVAVF